MELRPNRRQFVIANRPILVASDWLSVELENGFHLSYQMDLPVQVSERDGQRTITLGHAIPLVETSGSDDFAAQLAGRFARITWPYVYPDPSSLFPVYYTRVSEEPFITSSIALAAKLTGSAFQRRPLRWGGLNWVVSTGSPVAGVKKLARDERILIPSASAEFTGRIVQPLGTFGEAKTQLADGLVAVASRLREWPGTVYLALTAGLDSRTLLSALLAADVRFECVTQAFEGVNRADVDTAVRICRYLGVKHHVVEPEPFDERRLETWREHTLETYHDADDTYLIPQNQYRFLRGGDVLVRGGCFELGRRFYENTLAGLSFENATGNALWSRFENGPPDLQQIDELDRWLDFRLQCGNGLDLIDAFYLDQRVGGWLSAVEHGLDLNEGASIPPANSDRIFSALITPSEIERREGRLQRDTIKSLSSSLLRFPINPKSLSERSRDFLRGGRNKIKSLMKALPIRSA